MQDAPATGAAVLRDPKSSVDDALRNWRGETDRRRSAFQQQAAAHNAEQLVRRRRFYGFVGSSAAVAALIGATTMALLAPRVTPVEPAFAALVPTLEAEGVAQVERTVQAAPERAASIVGEVRHWKRDGGLWVQFDYAGDPDMQLHWFDAAGTEVLDANPCVNRLPGGGYRCYVGRTAERVGVALSNGAKPGTWSVQACQGAHCSTVATYPVD